MTRGDQNRQGEDSTGPSVATLVGMSAPSGTTPTATTATTATANTSRTLSVSASRRGCAAADQSRLDSAQDNRPFHRLSSPAAAEQAAVTKRRHTLSTHAAARAPRTACAASSTEYVTHALACSSRLSRDAERQQAGATDTSGPAPAFLGALPLPPSSASPATCPELHGEAARWSSDLLSVIRAMVQQGEQRGEIPTGHASPVGRADEPDDANATTGRPPESPLFVTPYPAASSAAVVAPEAMHPAGSTSDRAALRSSPGLSLSRAPFPVPAVDSPSSSPISLPSPPMEELTTPHADHTDQPAMSPRRDIADTRSPSSTQKPSPPPDMTTERRSSVHFRDPVVSGRASAGGSRSGRTTAADAVPTEFSPVDKKWGVLFDARGEATGRFGEVMQSLARYIIEHLLPAGHIVIVPEKLASFYSISRLEKEAVLYSAMLETPAKDLHRRLADLYENLGCAYHLVQARRATRPSVPALTPDGFARWMALHAQAFPDQEARRLDRLVSTSPLETRSPLDGKPERLPKQLSRHLLPRTPVAAIREQLQEAVRRHFGETYLATPAVLPSAATAHRRSHHLPLPPPPPVGRGLVSVSASRGRLPPVVHQDRGSDEQEAERRRRRSPSRTRSRGEEVRHVTSGSGSRSRRATYYECVPQSHRAGQTANGRQSRMSEPAEALPPGSHTNHTNHTNTRANMRKPVDGGSGSSGGGSRRTMGIDSGGRRARGEGGGHISQTWDDFLQRFR